MSEAGLDFSIRVDMKVGAFVRAAGDLCFSALLLKRIPAYLPFIGVSTSAIFFFNGPKYRD